MQKVIGVELNLEVHKGRVDNMEISHIITCTIQS